jgi:NitT/TauT family transport system substrate-binding protein
VLAAPAARAQSALRIGAGVSDTYAEALYAQETGFFKRAGIEAEVTNEPNGTVTLTAIIAGALDVGITNTIGVATAVTRGIPLVIVGSGALYVSDAPTTVLSVARDAPLRRAKDLEGKTVGTSGLQDMNTLGAKAWLSANGADLTKIRFVELGFPQMGPALKRGTVDAATMNEPFLSAEQSNVRTLAKMFDTIGRRFVNGVWIATPAFVRANGPELRRFIDAIYATAKWANAHHPETAAILSKASRVDAETTRTMTRAAYAESFDPRLVQPSLDVAWKFKALDRHVEVADLLMPF